jgi:hypothetical protein
MRDGRRRHREDGSEHQERVEHTADREHAAI